MSALGQKRTHALQTMLSHQLLGTGRARRVHKTLHKHQIEPATEFVSDLSKMCNSLKTEALMKTDRGIVGRINTSDHHVLSQRKRTRKQSLNKRVPRLDRERHPAREPCARPCSGIPAMHLSTPRRRQSRAHRCWQNPTRLTQENLLSIESGTTPVAPLA